MRHATGLMMGVGLLAFVATTCAASVRCELQQAQQPGDFGVSILLDGMENEVGVSCQVFDIFGSPLRQFHVTVSSSAKPVQIPVPIPGAESRRAAIVRVMVRNAAGEVLAVDEASFAADPVATDRVGGSDRFGVVAYPYIPDPWGDRFFGLVAASGVRAMMGFEMDRCYDETRQTIEPSRMRPLTDRLRAAGVDTLVSVLAYSPTWATDVPTDRPELERRYAEPDRATWLELVRAYVTDSDFDAYQVWGEPNGNGWTSQPKAQTYADFMAATAAVIREADPHARVIGCNANYGGPDWPASVLQHAGPGSIDYVSYHPYRTGGSHLGLVPPEVSTEFLSSYPQIVRSVDAATAEVNHGRRMPVWITETGVAAPDPAYGVTLLTQAQYVPRCLLILAAEGVEKTFWFSFHDVSGSHWGLVAEQPPYLVKPGWWAMRTLNQCADGRSIGALQQWADDVFAVPMTGNDDTVLAVWSVERPKVISVHGKLLESFDLLGQPIKTVSSETDHVLVLPAGSAVYLRGPTLHVHDLRLLVDLRPATETGVSLGDPARYRAVVTSEGERCLGPLPGELTTSDLVDEDRFAMHYSVLSLHTVLGDLNVPVTVPVTPQFKPELHRNGHAVVLTCYNHSSKPMPVVIEAQFADRTERHEASVAPNERWDLPMQMTESIPGDRQPVSVRVIADGQRWEIRYEAWFAAVPRSPRSTAGIPFTTWKSEGDTVKPNADDLSAHMVMRSNGTGLEIIVDVSDDRYAQPYSDADAWRGDSLTLVYSAIGGRSPKRLTFYRDGRDRPALYCADLNQRTDQLLLDIRQVGNITTYHVTLPWEMLGITGMPGDAVLMSLAINENDGNGHDGYLRWADGIETDIDPARFGYVMCAARE